MKNPLIIVGLGVAALLAFGGKLAYNASRLMFYIAKIGPRLSGLTPYIDIDVMVQNPTGQAYDLTAFTVEAFYNNTSVGNASSFDLVTLKEYSASKVVIPVRVSVLGAASALFSGGGGGGVIRIAGTATVNYLPIPINVSYKII